MSLGPKGNGRVITVHAYGMCNVSYVCYSTSTCIPLCKYNDFLICLGMVRPMQVDGIFHCLQRGRFCPEALRAAQYVLCVLLHYTQHA